MMKYFLLFFTIVFAINLFSTTYHVELDGSGDYTTIQEGIDAASNNDTVLVYPGIYFENLVINSKDIVLASLYVGSEQDSFIYQTIIDADYNDDNCLTILSSNNTKFIGFTARHGKGNSESEYGMGGGVFIDESSVEVIACHILDNNSFDVLYGGGIYVDHSSVNIISCKIENNRAQKAGGGVYLYYSNGYFSNTVIKGNHAINVAGGLYTHHSSVVFSSTNRSSVFSNYSGVGNDCLSSMGSDPINIVLDTFTIAEPTQHFLWPLNNLTWDVQNFVLEQVESDLYISPDGDDQNSGVSPDDPLQTLHFALSKIQADSLNPRSIYLADGIYSYSLNNQLFAANLKGWVSIVGESVENTILDGEDNTSFFWASREDPYSRIEKVSMRNGYNRASPVFVGRNPYFEAKDLIIEDMHIINEPAGIDIYEVDNYLLENITVRNGMGCYSIQAVRSNGIINNCKVENITADGPPDYRSRGGGIYMIDCDSVAISNTLVANCESESDMGYLLTGIGFTYVEYGIINNCTVINGHGGPPIFLGGPPNGANVFVNNLISYNNVDLHSNSSIMIGDIDTQYPVELNISNSCVENGEYGIKVYEGANYNWLDGNISDDPLFDENSNYPYYLQPGSPCIDAGTPDTTGLGLLPWDILGNPRIYGGRIDMGCYEWNPDDITGEYKLMSKSESALYNYPNPFNPLTTIFYNIQEAGKVELNIYNIKGQLVRNLVGKEVDAGQHSIIWNGKNDNGESLSSSVYFYKLEAENQPVLINKMILLK